MSIFTKRYLPRSTTTKTTDSAKHRRRHRRLPAAPWPAAHAPRRASESSRHTVSCCCCEAVARSNIIIIIIIWSLQVSSHIIQSAARDVDPRGWGSWAAWKYAGGVRLCVDLRKIPHFFIQHYVAVSFTSSEMKYLCQKWKTKLFLGAYRLSGTGNVENNHRIIKRMAARSGGGLHWRLTDPDPDMLRHILDLCHW